jgi:hypothetical protein
MINLLTVTQGVNIDRMWILQIGLPIFWFGHLSRAASLKLCWFHFIRCQVLLRTPGWTFEFIVFWVLSFSFLLVKFGCVFLGALWKKKVCPVCLVKHPCYGCLLMLDSVLPLGLFEFLDGHGIRVYSCVCS